MSPLHPDVLLVITLLGAGAFGVVMGWVTYRTLRRTQVTGLADIATVLGAVGGAAVTALFNQASGAFGGYCIGLAFGFFAYLKRGQEPDAPEWLGGRQTFGGRRDSGVHLGPAVDAPSAPREGVPLVNRYDGGPTA